MPERTSANAGETLEAAEAERLRRLLRAVGEHRTVELTGLSGPSLARLAAGLTAKRATVIVARHHLARLKIEELAR